MQDKKYQNSLNKNTKYSLQQEQELAKKVTAKLAGNSSNSSDINADTITNVSNNYNTKDNDNNSPPSVSELVKSIQVKDLTNGENMDNGKFEEQKENADQTKNQKIIKDYNDLLKVNLSNNANTESKINSNNNNMKDIAKQSEQHKTKNNSKDKINKVNISQNKQPKNQETTNQDIDNRVLQNVLTLADKFFKREKYKFIFNNIFRFLILGLIIYFIFSATEDKISPQAFQDDAPHVAVVKLKGIIADETDISWLKFKDTLERAFENSQAKGVVILANSPGGSPVQADLLYKEVKYLKKKYKKGIITYIEDICTSACYYVAVASDKIYANPNSIIGSIGVRLDAIGMQELIKKIGIEDRSMYAGKHKGFLNPLAAIDKKAKHHIQTRILNKSHENFINVVKDGRKDKLKNVKDIFSGLVWLADDAVTLGLIDSTQALTEASEKTFGHNKFLIYKPTTDYEDFFSDLIATEINSLFKKLTTGDSEIKLE